MKISVKKKIIVSSKENLSIAEYERGLGEQHTLLEVPN